MASVPSAGCLLARNQFYRGLPELIEKCWWLKNFFHCEPVPCPSVQINMSSN
uniref:Uncharacterized protein n=1 Tax=Xenopus tropicalis TaxID=8364 RepID=A0A6I8RT96_XENTR